MAGVKGRSGGHNRLSAEEHQLRGNYRPGRHGSLAVAPARPPADVPAPVPAGLSRGAQKAWRGYMADFDEWTRTDLSLLELALRSKDRAEQCRRRISAEGLTLRSRRGGTRLHPLVRVERDAIAFVLNTFKQLGLERRS
jgi:P27 family predicted phage terminase small subunit